MQVAEGAAAVITSSRESKVRPKLSIRNGHGLDCIDPGNFLFGHVGNKTFQIGSGSE